MSWPEQWVSPPIYNIKARYVAEAAALFLSLAKLHRQTFHRVREDEALEFPRRSIYTYTTHNRFSFALLATAAAAVIPVFQSSRPFFTRPPPGCQ